MENIIQSNQLVLGFLNYKGKKDMTSNAFYLSKFNIVNNSFIEKVDNFIDIIVINLQEISEKLEKKEDIYILSKKIDDIGRNWLKLLSLRHWAIKTDDKYFKIPLLKINNEINSAIEYLSNIKSPLLANYYEGEEKYFHLINKAAKLEAKEMVEDEKKAEKAENEKKKLKKWWKKKKKS